MWGSTGRAEVATEPRAVGRADSRLGLLLQSALWRECAVKPWPRYDTMRNSATWTLLCPRTMMGPWRCSRQVSLCTSVPNWRWTSPFGAPLRRTGQRSQERPGWTVPSARGHGRTRNGSIRNSSVLTGVASWWLLLKLEDVGAKESLQFRGKLGGSESP